MEKVTGWRTSDGKFHLDEESAKIYEKDIKLVKELGSIFKPFFEKSKITSGGPVTFDEFICIFMQHKKNLHILLDKTCPNQKWGAKKISIVNRLRAVISDKDSNVLQDVINFLDLSTAVPNY